MKRLWLVGLSAALCLGFLVYGNYHYHAGIKETRTKAYKQYTEEQTSQSLKSAQLYKERESISSPQQKKLKDAHKILEKVYKDSKYKSSELKDALQDLTPLIDQKEYETDLD